MKYFREMFLCSVKFLVVIVFCFFILNSKAIKAQTINKKPAKITKAEPPSKITNVQNKPLTYPEINTSLNAKLPKQFKDKTQFIAWLIVQIKQRQIDKPLTSDREEDLRQAGATDELIAAIKANSPPLIKPTSISPATSVVKPDPPPTSKPAYSAFLERGDDFFNKFDFDQAIEEYNKVLLLDPQNVNALIQRGYARHYKGDSNFDFADYNSAVGINSALASEPEMICVLYDTTKDVADNAIENCDKAISAKSNFSLFYYKRANAYRQKNDLDKAVSNYNETINLYPNFYNAYLNRGRIFASKLDYDKAVVDFDRVIAINPKNSSGYFARGQTHRARKDYGKAFADFNRILELEPKNAAAVYLERGFTYQFQDLLLQAENEFNKAIEFDPKMATTYNARGYLYFTKSKDDQAILDYTKAIELSPKFGGAYFNRAFAYERKKNYDKAIADLDKVIEIDSKFWGAYNNRGLYYFRRGDYNRAIENYDKSIEIEANVTNYRNRANAYEKLGQKDLAQSDRNSAINTTNRIKITKNKDADTLTSSFAGKVYDANKKPVYNAKVVVTNINNGFTVSRQTSKDGQFNIDGLSPGRYKIEISAQGYKTKTENYPLYAGTKIENINPFFLESEEKPFINSDRKDVSSIAGSLEGLIFGRDKKYSLNSIVKLTLVSGKGNSYTTRADTQGRFFVGGLLPGVYRIEISAPGYKTFTVEVRILAMREIVLPPVNMKLEH